VVKVLGTYAAPYGIMVSANAEYYKGYHWSIWGFQTGYWAYCYLPYGRGTETIPGHMYVDLSVEKDFRLTGGVSLGVRLNVTNVLNSQRPFPMEAERAAHSSGRSGADSIRAGFSSRLTSDSDLTSKVRQPRPPSHEEGGLSLWRRNSPKPGS